MFAQQYSNNYNQINKLQLLANIMKILDTLLHCFTSHCILPLLLSK